MSSVNASLNRIMLFVWLSPTWCTTCLTVQPPGRYGVFNCSSDKVLTAFRTCCGKASIMAMYSLISDSLIFFLGLYSPTGKRRLCNSCSFILLRGSLILFLIFRLLSLTFFALFLPAWLKESTQHILFYVKMKEIQNNFLLFCF